MPLKECGKLKESMKEKFEVQMWKIFLKQNSTSAVFRGNNVLNITLRIEKFLRSYQVWVCRPVFNKR